MNAEFLDAEIRRLRLLSERLSNEVAELKEANRKLEERLTANAKPIFGTLRAKPK